MHSHKIQSSNCPAAYTIGTNASWLSLQVKLICTGSHFCTPLSADCSNNLIDSIISLAIYFATFHMPRYSEVNAWLLLAVVFNYSWLIKYFKIGKYNTLVLTEHKIAS